MNTPTGRFLLIDWGTSNVRVWLVDGNLKVRDAIRSGEGITRIKNGEFHKIFQALTSSLTPEPVPALMSGMIGSRQGWIEAPYLDCPISLTRLASGLIQVPEAPHIHIVPGVHFTAPDKSSGGGHDVMRGEETQIAGALALMDGADDGLVCLPGTHSKWARITDNSLGSFSTAMTGEVYAALSQHTILGALLPDSDEKPEISTAGFDMGLARSAKPGGLLHHLFGVRANGLFDAIAADDLRGYLSGILIGHEIRATLAEHSADLPVFILGDDQLAGLYAHAMEMLERPAQTINAEAATLAGLGQILEQSSFFRN